MFLVQGSVVAGVSAAEVVVEAPQVSEFGQERAWHGPKGRGEVGNSEADDGEGYDNANDLYTQALDSHDVVNGGRGECNKHPGVGSRGSNRPEQEPETTRLVLANYNKPKDSAEEKKVRNKGSKSATYIVLVT